MLKFAILSLIGVGSGLVLQAANPLSVENLIDGGHWKRARVILEDRVRRSPRDANATYQLAQVRLAFGVREEALKLAQNALAIDKGNADYHFLRARILGEIAENSSFLKQWTYGSRFKDEAETVLTLNPKHTDARYALMLFYLRAPSYLGGRKKAESLVTEIETLNPFEGCLARAAFAEEIHDLAATERYYLKAVSLLPADYESRTSLAAFYASDQQKKYGLAEMQARTASRLEPGRSSAYVTLASVMAKQTRLTELDALLTASEKNDGDDFSPHYEAARVFAAAGIELDRAERLFRKYLAQEPEGGAPTLASGHWQLAHVLERRGLKSQAVAELQTALRLQPDFDQAKKDLGRLN